ncbi:hypothetical protein M9H77_35996 [Catharanthus roseus]|uniref:Uncharacterized protein n=1 Tax=Catharanthus roseus TaxID=4058 RepID=A0ACB9ZT61_CATRO|nr:hypothetical protein M9H77_35996 [Catharanthus roseus]
MATLKLAVVSQKCIFPAMTVHGNIWISRLFVTATGPSLKMDKETCEKVKEAADAVKEGMKETRETGQFIKETMNASAGEVITEMAKKALDVATEDNEEKGTWEKIKLVIKKSDSDK